MDNLLLRCTDFGIIFIHEFQYFNREVLFQLQIGFKFKKKNIADVSTITIIIWLYENLRFHCFVFSNMSVGSSCLFRNSFKLSDILYYCS